MTAHLVRFVLLAGLLTATAADGAAAAGDSAPVPAPTTAGTVPPERTVVRSHADLPPRSFPLTTKPSELLTDSAAFEALAELLRADIESTLANYDIQDAATLGALYASLRDLALLRGDAGEANDYNARLRALQTKPADRWLSGLQHGAVAAALSKGGDAQAHSEEIHRHLERTLAPMPWALVGNDIKQLRSGVEVLNENVVTGIAISVLDPVQEASGELSRGLVVQLLNLKLLRDLVIPHAAAQLTALDAYIAAHDERKPDLWAQRDAVLDEDEKLTPVVVGIWDSGVDVSLFPGRLHMHDSTQESDLDDRHGIAFDLDGNREAGLLLPLPPEFERRKDELFGLFKGSLDASYQVDSPEAAAFRAHIAGLGPADMGPFMEDMARYFDYVHGTHVAGVAVAGNPAARLVVVRDTFPSRLSPPPFTRAHAQGHARMYREAVDYLKAQGARVVNMSWISSPRDIERMLEANALGGTPEQRRAEAQATFAIVSAALTDALRSAPEILFVPAAGNSDEDVAFIEAIPAGIDLPNVLTAGAVDQAGDETRFTSHGRLVRVHANGYEVDGPVPGGRRVHWHGTSLAAPQVTNLAAKLFALDPSLTVAEVVQLILDGAERSEDGRRNLIHPKRSIELLEQREGSHGRVASSVAATGGDPGPVPPRFPIRDFFANPERGYFRLSDDGSRLAFMQPVTFEGAAARRLNIFVQPIEAARPVGEPRLLTRESARDINDFYWKGSRTVLYRKDFAGDENFHVVAVDVDSGEITDLTPGEAVRAEVVDYLPDDPEHVLIAHNRRDPEVMDVYRIALTDGSETLVARNPGDVTTWLSDHAGRLRVGIRSDGLNSHLIHRDDESKPFQTLLTVDYRSEVRPLFFDAENSRLYAFSNRGRDRLALVLIDPENPDRETVIFEHDRADLDRATWSRARQRLATVEFITERPERHVFDPTLKPVFEVLERKLPGLVHGLQDSDRSETRFIVLSGSDREPGLRSLYDVVSGELTELARFSEALPRAALAAMTPIQYAAGDGLVIHGYLTLPVGRVPSALPCIVHPHGGPWARDIWGYDPEVQFLANRGFCVLQMNFRASTGYGRSFLEAGFKQWGLRMQDDVSDGARWLIESGVADPQRLGIYGTSYGGYATLAGVAFTPELYAAAVANVGVSNLFTFLETIPPYWEAWRPQMYAMIGHPEQDREQLAATSPALHAERIRAPLLIVQGARDPRVNRSESDQMVAALRGRDVDVEYLVKDDEGHGFTNEENVFEFYAAMEAFFDRHLQP